MENLTMNAIREKEFKDMVNEVNLRIQNNEELPPANIIVAGITGAGKSTLINAVFGKGVAPTGRGKPVTDTSKKYEDENVPIRIWDTVGFELSEEKRRAVINDIRDIICRKSKEKDKFDRIHAIWYCVNAGGNRFQETEANFVIELHRLQVPFIIVITQCFFKNDDTKFENEIKEMLSKKGVTDIPIIQVLAQEKEIEIGIIPAKGLKELVDLTIKNIPDYLKNGFIAAQKIDKDIKRIASIGIISEYVKLAKEGFWDKIPLANIATANNKIKNMFKDITRIYNSKFSDKELERLVDVIRCSLLKWNGKILTLLNPSNRKLHKDLSNLINVMNIETNLIEEKFKSSEKSALFIAFAGMTSLNAIEEEWDNSTEKELRDIDKLAQNLKKKLDDIIMYADDPKHMYV